MINIRTPEEIEKIARAGKLTADTLSFLAKNIKPGISTLDIDRMAEKYIRDRGGIPSEKGYCGYPGSICASVNEVVVHGIPSARKILRKGDIISLDLVVELNGYMGDSCITVPVGHCSKKVAQLLKVTEESLYAGIKQAVVGNHIGDIGHAVESTVKPYGYGVLRDYVGHEFKSLHQYMLIKSENKEALMAAVNILQSEVENSSLMIKQCVPLEYEEVVEMYAPIYKKGDGRQ